MRISLVIPTRERIATLRSCLELALSCDDPDLEVVVSDNHSMDGTDAYLATMTDPRLKVVRPEGRVAMRLNFETGLNAATGDYVIVIGDDDGVLPSGLRWLRAVLEKDRPEVVNVARVERPPARTEATPRATSARVSAWTGARTRPGP